MVDTPKKVKIKSDTALFLVHNCLIGKLCLQFKFNLSNFLEAQPTHMTCKTNSGNFIIYVFGFKKDLWHK